MKNSAPYCNWIQRLLPKMIVTTSALTLFACGGGSDSDTSIPTTPEESSPPASTFLISTTVGAGGSISPTSASVTEGETATFTLAMEEGYEIESISGCNGSLTNLTYTIGEASTDCEISVTFLLTPPDEETEEEGEDSGETNLEDNLGEQKTLVALIGFKNQENKITRQQAHDLIQNNPNSLNTFIKENSNNKAWLESDVLDWVELDKEADEYFSADNYDNEKYHDDAIAAISNLADLASYDRLILMGSRSERGNPGCYAYQTKRYVGPDNHYFGYFAVMGGGGLADDVVGCLTPGRIAHEYGHTFGFGHIFETDCAIGDLPQSLIDRHFDNSCQNKGYWETYDTMSFDVNYPLYSAIWRSEAGWLEDDQVTVVSESGLYTLTQASLSSSGTKLLKIPIGQGLEGKQLYYYVEYRKKLGGFDEEEFIAKSQEYEVLVRHTDFNGGIENKDKITYGYETAEGIREAITPLDVGQDYVDTYRNLSFRVERLYEDQEMSVADIRVSLPALTILPSYVYRFSANDDQEQTVTLKNTSDDSWVVSSLTMKGRHPNAFAVSNENCIDQPIMPQGKCEINVSRVRDTASLGFLAISINDGDILHAAELMGESLLIETEFDPNAPLEWQDYTSQYAKDINWEDAVAYCHDLSFNSHDDWRLPRIEELRAAFQQSSTPLYNITTQLWSISEPAGNLYNAYYIDGSEAWYNGDKLQKYNALCVRSQ